VKTLFFALGALALVGCTGIHPVGPMAKIMPDSPKPAKTPPAAPADAVAKVPAMKPTPPTMYVTPADVNPDNPAVAANKLTSELGVDGKATPNAPVTAEFSRYKGGVKQP
jgi:hypothetical protein